MIFTSSVDEKLRNEACSLCPAVPDMRCAGKQLNDLKLILLLI